MKKVICSVGVGLLTLLATGFAALASDQSGTPVSIVVTAEAKRGKTIPPLLLEDLAVTQGRDKRQITSLESLSGSKLQLLLMIDDSAAGSFNTEIQSLKGFVLALPANAEIGVGYMRNG